MFNKKHHNILRITIVRLYLHAFAVKFVERMVCSEECMCLLVAMHATIRRFITFNLTDLESVQLSFLNFYIRISF